MAVVSRGNARGRLERLEARIPLPADARSSGARERLKGLLDRMAAARRGALGPCEEAETRATVAEARGAIERRLEELRGEGGR